MKKQLDQISSKQEQLRDFLVLIEKEKGLETLSKLSLNAQIASTSEGSPKRRDLGETVRELSEQLQKFIQEDAPAPEVGAYLERVSKKTAQASPLT